MAFTNSHRRCASFGVVTNLPDDVITQSGTLLIIF